MVLVLSLPCYALRVNLRVFAPQFLICKVGAILTLPSLESILRDRGCPILTLFAHSRRGIWALSPKQSKNEEQMVGGGDSQIPDAGTYLLPTNLTLLSLLSPTAFWLCQDVWGTFLLSSVGLLY